jgi:predicted RNA-binding Zn-ribbon protein involved in translation (DUF1610 family)
MNLRCRKCDSLKERPHTDFIEERTVCWIVNPSGVRIKKLSTTTLYKCPNCNNAIYGKGGE